MYEIIFSPTAKEDLVKLKRSEPLVFKKLNKLLLDIAEHPKTGLGHPKPLGFDKSGQWSRKITQKHRIIYTITEESLIVNIIAASGHYGDR